MIYTAEHRAHNHHHGQLVDISGCPPDNFDGTTLSFFVPTKDLEDWWNLQQVSKWAEYEQRYRKLLADRRQEVFAWLDSLSPYRPLPHMTLLCWEHDDQSCHRRLVMEHVIQKHKSGLAGGRDVGPIRVGDFVDWVRMPDYLEKCVNTPLKVRAVRDDSVWCHWIGQWILKSEIRKIK